MDVIFALPNLIRCPNWLESIGQFDQVVIFLSNLIKCSIWHIVKHVIQALGP
jgi:hypothetical protein